MSGYLYQVARHAYFIAFVIAISKNIKKKKKLNHVKAF